MPTHSGVRKSVSCSRQTHAAVELAFECAPNSYRERRDDTESDDLADHRRI